MISIQVACDINSGENVRNLGSFFKGFLQRYKVEEELTDNEKKIIFGRPDKQDVINMAWKYEAYWTLIWALGIVDKLEYPSQICDCNFAIRTVADYEDFNAFMKTIN